MFGFRRIFFLTALAAAAQTQDDDGSCDGLIISIANQTDIDTYKTCQNITGTIFGIDHSFQGAFNLSGVQSVPELIVGYLGPKLRGSSRVDDGVTSISMPDLETISGRGVLFGYIDNLTSVSLPKLETVGGDFVVAGSLALRNLSLPSLSSLTGAIDLDGDFDHVDFPSLASLSYLRIQTTGRINCPALGATFANLTFHPRDLDMYRGFICSTFNETNRWNSSDPKGNPTVAQAAAALNGSTSGSDSNSGSGTGTKTGGASIPQVGTVGYTIVLAFLTLVILG